MKLTNHAVEQYVARVKPAFSFDQAKREMQALLDLALDPPSTRPPDWTWPDPEHRGQEYLVVSDGVCLVIGGAAVVTCLIRGERSAERRAAKNEKKALRRKSKRFAASRQSSHRGKRPDPAWD